MEETIEVKDQDIDLYFILGVAYKNIKIISLITFIFVVLSVTYALLAEKKWSSKVRMYAMSRDSGGPLQELMQSLKLTGSTNAIYMSDIIKSRMIAERVMLKKYSIDGYEDSLNILEFWKLDKIKKQISEEMMWDYAFDKFSGCIDVNTNKETEIITLTTTFGSNKLAADVANSICDEITDYFRTQYNSALKNSRLYTEERLVDSRKELKEAETELEDFETTNQRVLAGSPSLNLQVTRMRRKISILQDIVVMLEKQRELLLIEEVKERPILHIIDKGRIHERHIEPKRKKIVIFYSVLGFILSVGFFVFKEKYLDETTIKKIKSVFNTSYASK